MQPVKNFPLNIVEEPIALRMFIKYFERRNNLFYKFVKAVKSSNSLLDLIKKVINYIRKYF